MKLIKNGDMTVLISRLFVSSSKYRNEVFGLTQSMFANHLEMIVERGFPLLRRINQILSTLRDMGLMSKLFVDFNYNMTILASIREMKQRQIRQLSPEEMSTIIADEEHESDDDPEIVLTVEHLEGAFSIVILGLSISSSVFVLEIIFHSEIFKSSIRWLLMKILCKKANEKAENIKESPQVVRQKRRNNLHRPKAKQFKAKSTRKSVRFL